MKIVVHRELHFDLNMDAIPHYRSVQDYEEMEICNSWEAILCIFGCVIIGGKAFFLN